MKLALWIGLCITAIVTMAIQPIKAQTPPNILLIVSDDCSEQTCTRADVMPNMLSYVRDQGVHMRNFVANTGSCAQSRATMYTGTYPKEHGIEMCNETTPTLGTWKDYVQAGWLDKELPCYLKAAGYHTSLSGKYIPRYGNQSEHTAAGLSYPYFHQPCYDKWFALHKTQYFNNWEATSQNQVVTRSTYSGQIIRERVIAQVDDAIAAEKPFFVVWAPINPHAGVNNEPMYPPAYAGLYSTADAELDVAGYQYPVTDKHPTLAQLPLYTPGQKDHINIRYRDRLRSMAAMDDDWLTIYNHLVTTGKLANTIIVFLSDNGFSDGQMGLGKLAPYRHVNHVPFYVAGPGIPVGQDRLQMMAMVDVAPTLLDLAGVAIPSHMSGQSYKSVIDGTNLCSRRWAFVQVKTCSLLTFNPQLGQMCWGSDRVISRSIGHLRWHDGSPDEAYTTNSNDEANIVGQLTAQQQTAKTNAFDHFMPSGGQCQGVQCHAYDSSECP